ncbi:MAG TPA: hypothetical protein VN605_02825 [Thermoanaerobaculia bacterium]|nr:hypothetical protein [Thermoanaerobaculia bacterium]
MITRSDLQKANDELTAERRRALGDPPTTEELLAYSRGELAPAEEERVRDLLVAYPDLARGIAEPFPRSGATPGEADYLKDADFTARWAALEKRLQGEGDGGAPVIRFHRRVELAMAAMLVLAFGVILLQAQANRRTVHDHSLPVASWEEKQLLPDGRRGPDGGSPSLVANGNAYMLIPSLIGADAFPRYRAEILDTTSNPPVRLWGTPIERRDNDTFRILVPSEFLSSGSRYQLVLYGIDDSHEERLAGYTFRVR